MNVPEGFKQTEVGVIPKDWEAVSFSDVILSTQLGGNYQTNSVDNGFPLIKMGNLGRGNIVLSKIEFIALPINISERDRLEYGDVLFNTRNTLELVGKVAIWRNDLPIAHFNSNIMRICFDSRKIGSNFFMNYILNSIGLVSQLKSIAIGTTSVAAIYSRDLFKIKIPLPSTKAEQTAIAAALSDMDALIEGVEKMLEKKRRIKQGTMQELLRPKEGWKEKMLGCFLTQKPQYGIGAAAVPYNEDLPTYLRITDISEDGKLIKYKLASVDNPFSSDYFLGNNDLVFARTGNSVGKSYLYNTDDGKLVFAGFLIRVKVDQTLLSPAYLKYFVQSKKYWNWIAFMSMRTGQPGINGQEYSMLPVDIPKTLQEQTAIAAILSDMDSEIQQLETQLVKYRQLKTGMMQELLTGKKRLV